MPGIGEASQADTPIASDLAEGVKAISINATLRFTKYQEAILPLDGYRFWVKKNPEQIVIIPGSLHYASDSIQDSSETYTLNNVVFTSLESIEDMNAISPVEVWIAEFEGITFSFNTRGRFYRQTSLYHYSGRAVFPDMRSQLVRSAGDLLDAEVIVSNSIPLWLALNNYQPPIPGHGFAPGVRLYPAYLAPQNIVPPFASVEVLEETTTAQSMAPQLSNVESHDQLVRETVKITFWGLRNAAALTFIDCINQYTLDYGTFGLANSPVIRDEKRTQSELSTISMKKSATFDIWYLQSTARNIARKTITEFAATFYPTGIDIPAWTPLDP